MVTAQLGYFFNVAAFSSRVFCASALRSLLSYSKNTGFSGELRLRSSSEAEAIASSRTGSGGTTVGSATGSGGAGGRELPLVDVVPGGGGGIGRATGGVFLPHAATLMTMSSRTA